ncbi:MAG: tRNA (N(6)-L-threonylcarbamoyladenosine(37)-C(2))-methylthiotransferase MtaB [Ruminococcus flavefaciens]|nr:tRNA (N(6)-L-threonylcarbamoyladenosine(37)-C(2))-methylthiotransferase MtaB [Ruminococcus flavefaciens]
MYKVFFITFGCKVNQYETECMKTAFRKKGFEISGKIDCADIVVINSCTVTEYGDNDVLSSLRKARKKLPTAVIALTGCYPQADRKSAENLSEADIVTGTKNRSETVSLVIECLEKRARKIQVADYSKGDTFESLDFPQFENNTRTFMKIQDGCNQFCTYCIIPYARGRCRSRSIESLRAEAENSARMGKKEIVLTGINLAFYGIEYGLNLADAVEVCAGVDGIERIRLGSLEPEKMSDDLLKRLSAVEKLCPHFHLSLQSGCNRTLKAMNRHYTAEEYYELTRRIRYYFPECSFTTDVMVGFPDETDEDFRESADFVRKVGFSRVHVFRYSRRKGTPADRMTGQIPEHIKSRRATEMAETVRQSAEEYMKSLVGKTVKVLFERENCTEFHRGYSADYTLIKIPRENSEKSLRNQMFYVTIEESHSDFCIGRMVSE